jgi:hypothetical protein
MGVNYTNMKISGRHVAQPIVKRFIFFTLMLFIFIASIPLMTTGVLQGHDTFFHLYRIEGLAEGLRGGSFPVYMQSTQINGYGYPVSIMYGDFFLYLPAILVYFGLSVTGAYKFFVIVVNTITFFSAFWFTRKATKSNFIGLVASALWGFSPYRLEDVYLRGSVGEYLALLFIPCIIYGLFVVLTARPKQAENGWAWLSIGVAGVVVSHVLSVMIILVIALPVIIIGIINKFWFTRVVLLVKSFSLSLLLSLFFIIPFIDFSRKANLAVLGIGTNSLRLFAYESSVDPIQLLTIFSPMVGQNQFKSSGLSNEMPYSIGWAILLMMSIWFFYRIVDTKHITILEIAILVSIFIGIFFMAPGPFNFWKKDFGFFLNHIIGILAEIQFPWRFLGPVSCLIIVLGIVALFYIKQNNLKLFPNNVVYYIGFSIIALALLEGGVALTSYSENALQVRDFSTNNEQYRGKGVMGGEYLPLHTDQTELFATNRPIAQGDVAIHNFSRDGSRFHVTVTSGSKGGDVIVPLLNYPYYHATGLKHNYGIINGDNNLIKLNIPENTSDSIEISFHPPYYWCVSTVASLLTFVYFLYRLLYLRKRIIHFPYYDIGSAESCLG